VLPALASCPDGEGFIDGACARIGEPCGSGEYATSLEGKTGIIYVKRGGAGNGSKSAPFGSIAAALAIAASSATIAIGGDGLDEDVILNGPITLVGACVERTMIGAGAASANHEAIRVTERAQS